MNASGEWDINSAQLSLCRVGMTRQSDSSIVFRWKKPVKFARALHRDSVPLTSGDFNYHAIRKKLRHNCAIQGARLIWKQKIWLAICELPCSLTNQNACFITFYCIQLPLFCTVLRKNCTVLSQSKSSNLIMYIIKSVIIRVITKSDDRAAGVRFVYHEYAYRLNWTTRSPIIN